MYSLFSSNSEANECFEFLEKMSSLFIVVNIYGVVQLCLFLKRVTHYCVIRYLKLNLLEIRELL